MSKENNSSTPWYVKGLIILIVFYAVWPHVLQVRRTLEVDWRTNEAVIDMQAGSIEQARDSLWGK